MQKCLKNLNFKLKTCLFISISPYDLWRLLTSFAVVWCHLKSTFAKYKLIHTIQELVQMLSQRKSIF